jgi:hypothetical protein
MRCPENRTVSREEQQGIRETNVSWFAKAFENRTVADVWLRRARLAWQKPDRQRDRDY